jgi:O-acetylhomoserine (thiol)-lyase
MQELGQCLYQTSSYVLIIQNTNLFIVRGGIYLHQIKQSYYDILEQRLAALEGGIAVVTASGTPAITTALLVLLKQVITSLPSSLYGGTFNLLQTTLPRLE